MEDKEKIKRIEQAPKEMQTMVAKAFLRDDIKDENIQYLFNTTPLEEMNDPDVVIENINADKPEGTGATGFTIRNYKPYDDKQYITRGSGGWSNCIKGYPMDDHANVLANCVGYASGRFNEIIEEARDYHECTYNNLCCNACDFLERAIEAGLQTGSTPRVGAIMCWGGGSSGAGHVEVVEIFNEELYEVQTSASDYGGTQFYNAMRTNNNGRWGLNSSFYFKGFIYQPDDVQKWINGEPLPPITPNVERDESKNQVEVIVDNLNVRTKPTMSSESLGYASIGFYDYFESVDNEGITWHKIADNQWIASNEGIWTKLFPKQEKKIELEILDEKDGYVLVDLDKVWIKK